MRTSDNLRQPFFVKARYERLAALIIPCAGNIFLLFFYRGSKRTARNRSFDAVLLAICI